MTAQMHKMWLVTHNNPKMSLQEYMEAWKPHVVYANGQIEAGENDTVHIQAYLSLQRSQRLSWLKKKDGHAHFEPVKIDNGASRYCLKEETRLEGPIEVGKRPIAKQVKKDWDKIWEYAKTGQFEEIEADVRLRYYGQILRIFKDHQTLPKRTEPKKCYWYYGAPRTGKSRKAREDGDPYIKLSNKWWDGYTGQKKVVIDDLGAEKGKTLVDHLKLWADPWHNQPGENKGGQLPLIYDELIVTSNYTPESIASGADLIAIKARFEEIEFE